MMQSHPTHESRRAMNATAHFQTRAQQRAISPSMIELILTLGRTNGKGDLVLLSTKDLEQVIRDRKEELRLLEKMRSHGGAGIAFEDDTLNTCFHRHKKFKR